MKYFAEYQTSGSEDAFRHLVEMPDKEEITRLVSELYQNTLPMLDKVIILEILSELGCDSAIQHIERIVLNADSQEEWKESIEARVKANDSSAIDFIRKECDRLTKIGNKSWQNECEEILDDLVSWKAATEGSPETDGT